TPVCSSTALTVRPTFWLTCDDGWLATARPTPTPPASSTTAAAAPSSTCRRLWRRWDSARRRTKAATLASARPPPPASPRPPARPPVPPPGPGPTAGSSSRTARPVPRRPPGTRPGAPRTPAGPAVRAGPARTRRRRCARCSWARRSCRHPAFGQGHPQRLERVVDPRLDRAHRDAEYLGRLVHGAVPQDRLVEHVTMGRRELLQRLGHEHLAQQVLGLVGSGRRLVHHLGAPYLHRTRALAPMLVDHDTPGHRGQ